MKHPYELYAITDRSWLNGKTLAEQVEESLQGGVTCIQLREKDAEKELVLQEAKEIKALCRKYGVPFIINDNVDLALEVDADGVHIGQSDGDPALVREKIGPDKILGVTAKTVEQAVTAWKGGADYLGCGAVFGTSTKKDAISITMERLEEVCKSVPIPVVAIGGITAKNAPLLKNASIEGIAVVSAVYAQPDIRKACRELLEILSGFAFQKK